MSSRKRSRHEIQTIYTLFEAYMIDLCMLQPGYPSRSRRVPNIRQEISSFLVFYTRNLKQNGVPQILLITMDGHW